jgi:hypothetical protein
MQCHFFETLFLFNFRGLWDVRHDVDSTRLSSVESHTLHCLSVRDTRDRRRASHSEASAYIYPDIQRDFTQCRQASQCCPFAPDASRAILASPRHMISARHGMVQLNFMRAQKTS